MQKGSEVSSLGFARRQGCFQQHPLQQDLPLPQAQLQLVTHRNSHMVLDGHGTYHIKKGTRQGDRSGVRVFCKTYNGAVEAYRAAHDARRMVMEIHMFGLNLAMDMSVTTYVDDVAELMIADTVEELAAQLAVNSSILNARLADIGGSLEPSKEVLLMKWCGKGAKAQENRAQQLEDLTAGSMPSCARHLGAWLQTNGTHGDDVTKHIAAMRTGFYAFHGLWSSSRVPFRMKRIVFKAVVSSAGLAGLEPYVLTQTDLDRLEVARDLLMRRIFGRAGWGAVAGSPDHQSVPSHSLRKKADLPTIESTLRQRRLLWFQKVVAKPAHHVMYLTSLFGHFSWEPLRTELDEHGVPLPAAVPALRQLHRDLCLALPGFTGFIGEWLSHFVGVKNDFAHVLSYRRPLRAECQPHPDTSTVEGPEGFAVDTTGYSFPCDTCPAQFLTKRALNMHQVSAHKARRADTAHITTCRCPICSRSFATVGSAKRHFLAVCSKRHVASDGRAGSPTSSPRAGRGRPSQLGHAQSGCPSPQPGRSCPRMVPERDGVSTGTCHAGGSSDLRLTPSGQGQGPSGWAQADHASWSSSSQVGRVRPFQSRGGRAVGAGSTQPYLGARQNAQHIDAAGDPQVAHQGVPNTAAHAARDSGVLLVQGEEGRQVRSGPSLAAAQSSSSDPGLRPLLFGGSGRRANFRVPASQWSHERVGLGDWRRQSDSQGSSAQVTLDHIWGRGAF